MQALFYNVRPIGWLTCRLLRRLWPGCLVSPLGGVSLRDVGPPELPGDDWVRLRTLLGGICGTDQAIIAQKQPPSSILQAFSSMPMILGHENVAVVEEVGPDVDAAWVGKRVCVEPTLCCRPRGIEPPCPRCRDGLFGTCENFGSDSLGSAKLPPGTSIGYNRRTGGSMGEYFVAHESQLVAVPDELTDEQAILTDPAACSLHAALRTDLSQAKRVLVYGAGVLGMGLIGALRAIGYDGRIDALDRSEYVADLAVRLGADELIRLPRRKPARYAAMADRLGAAVVRARLGSRMLIGGYDVAFDCVGSAESFNECLNWTRSGGQVMMIGTGHGGRIDLTPLWFGELIVRGSYGRQVEQFGAKRMTTYQLVHELMAEGKLKLDGLITHRFALSEYRRAFDVALHKSAHRALKVVFDFRSAGDEAGG